MSMNLAFLRWQEGANILTEDNQLGAVALTAPTAPIYAENFCSLRDFLDGETVGSVSHLIVNADAFNAEEVFYIFGEVRKRKSQLALIIASHFLLKLCQFKSLRPHQIIETSDLNAAEFLEVLKRATQLVQIEALEKSADKVPEKSKNKGFVGDLLQSLCLRVPKIMASSARAVHVFGETGTGKEAVADIFEAEIKGRKSFVRVNCGALAGCLLESELFGYKKGAFTGSLSEKVGLFEVAHGGWIFLDEVSHLSHHAQVALLRVIENQEVTRIGETLARKINVRIISATNDDLSKKVMAGEFREDLYQRLVEIRVDLSPLRERTKEIVPIAEALAIRMEGGPFKLTNTVQKFFEGYSWQRGNVRELRNCLRAMTENHVDKVLDATALPDWFLGHWKTEFTAKNTAEIKVRALRA